MANHNTKKKTIVNTNMMPRYRTLLKNEDWKFTLNISMSLKQCIGGKEVYNWVGREQIVNILFLYFSQVFNQCHVMENLIRNLHVYLKCSAFVLDIIGILKHWQFKTLAVYIIGSWSEWPASSWSIEAQCHSRDLPCSLTRFIVGKIIFW